MSIVKYVRGNTMLLTVTLTEKHEEGDPTVVDVEAYDSWAANVYRCGSVAKSKVGGVVTGVDEEKRVTLVLPPTLTCGVYSVEIVLYCRRGTATYTTERRSFEVPIFEVVETNGDAYITYELIDGMRSADIDMTFQFVETAAVIGESAYEEWKKLPGHEDKTLQDFIDEVRVPAGGSTGQILRKKSDNDYDTEWVDDEGGGKQADWNETDSTDPAYIKNKPTIPAEVTEITVAGWGFTKNTGTYSKPSTGIPASDLSSAVQTSLGKADSALQSETDPTVPSWAKASSKPTYTAQEVGALPADTPIPVVPTNVSAFNNDAGYLTSHQDISGKEDKVDIVSASGTTLTAEVDKYYTLSNVGTLAITLPTIAAGTTKVKTVTFYISAGSTPAVTWTSTHNVYKAKGFQIEANGTYEVSAAWNGIAWVVALVEIEIPT